MVSNIAFHIVLSLTLVEEQRTTFPRQKMVVHISGGLSLPSANHYDVTRGETLKIMAESKL